MKTPTDYNAILKALDWRFINGKTVAEMQRAAALYRKAKARAIRQGATICHPYNVNI